MKYSLQCMHLTALLYILFSYLLGALPMGVWISRWQGVDILKAGSGNPGATNVKRVLGAKWGHCVFFLDCLKGFAAVLLPEMTQANASLTYLKVFCLTAALVGHCFSVFIQFKGGKGVATLMGGLLGLMPLVLASALGVWAIVFYTTRYVSLASIFFALSLPIWCWVWDAPTVLSAFSTLIALAIILLHRANLKRLLVGKEHRFKY